MRSEAKTVHEYIASLPAERRAALTAVREMILTNLPEGYVETMDWGMISYQVPLARYPDTYNGKPLMYAALASQKAYMVVYLSAIYADASARAAFEKAYRATGKRYDVGQSCVRFRKLDDLPLDVIGTAIASTPVDAYVEHYQRSRPAPSRTGPEPTTSKSKPKSISKSKPKSISKSKPKSISKSKSKSRPKSKPKSR